MVARETWKSAIAVATPHRFAHSIAGQTTQRLVTRIMHPRQPGNVRWPEMGDAATTTEATLVISLLPVLGRLSHEGTLPSVSADNTSKIEDQSPRLTPSSVSHVSELLHSPRPIESPDVMSRHPVRVNWALIPQAPDDAIGEDKLNRLPWSDVPETDTMKVGPLIKRYSRQVALRHVAGPFLRAPMKVTRVVKPPPECMRYVAGYAGSGSAPNWRISPTASKYVQPSLALPLMTKPVVTPPN